MSKKAMVSVLVVQFMAIMSSSLFGQVEVSRQSGGGPRPQVGAHEILGKFMHVDLPVKGTVPVAIAVDAQQNIWIAESGANRVLQLDPYTGDFYPLVNREPAAGIQDIAFDGLGNVWFTQFGIPEKRTKGHALGVVSRGSGNVVEYRSITSNSGPHSIVLDSEGFVYATLYYANAILRIDPDTSETREYAIPTRSAPWTDWEGDSSLPTGIAADRQGKIWFCQTRGNKIGRLDPNTGEIREYDIPIKNARPYGIAIDSQGFPWFTLQGAHRVAQLDFRTGRIRDWDVGAVRAGFQDVTTSYPTGIEIDSNDVVWISELGTNTIVSIDPKADRITKYRIPWASAVSSKVLDLAIDALGSVWFVDAVNHRIGRLE